jgi:hypothetical protein
MEQENDPVADRPANGRKRSPTVDYTQNAANNKRLAPRASRKANCTKEGAAELDQREIELRLRRAAALGARSVGGTKQVMVDAAEQVVEEFLLLQSRREVPKHPKAWARAVGANLTKKKSEKESRPSSARRRRLEPPLG